MSKDWRFDHSLNFFMEGIIIHFLIQFEIFIECIEVIYFEIDPINMIG